MINYIYINDTSVLIALFKLTLLFTAWNGIYFLYLFISCFIMIGIVWALFFTTSKFFLCWFSIDAMLRCSSIRFMGLSISVFHCHSNVFSSIRRKSYKVEKCYIEKLLMMKNEGMKAKVHKIIKASSQVLDKDYNHFISYTFYMFWVFFYLQFLFFIIILLHLPIYMKLIVINNTIMMMEHKFLILRVLFCMLA